MEVLHIIICKQSNSVKFFPTFSVTFLNFFLHAGHLYYPPDERKLPSHFDCQATAPAVTLAGYDTLPPNDQVQ